MTNKPTVEYISITRKEKYPKDAQIIDTTAHEGYVGFLASINHGEKIAAYAMGAEEGKEITEHILEIFVGGKSLGKYKTTKTITHETVEL